MKRPFTAYQGDEPYVFVCYAHENADAVYPQIQRLHEGGVRIWYDEGISPGTRWPEELARALGKASLVLFFCTPESIKSQHCQDEVNFALDEKRPLLVIQDGAVELPPGLRLRLGSQQSILKHELTRAQFEEKLANAISRHVVTGTPAVATIQKKTKSSAPRRWGAVLVVGVIVAGLATAAAVWLTHPAPALNDNPLADAHFSRFTDFDGNETNAAISRDGKFVAFIADRDGPLHVWLSQVGTGRFVDLMRGSDDQALPGGGPNLGFSADGSEIWLGGQPKGTRLRVMPLMGGPLRAFLGDNVVSVAWSPDGGRIVYHTSDAGDPTFVADGNGANPRRILVSEPGEHNHFPIWSTDGNWIYFVHGVLGTMALYRISASGGAPERLTQHDRDVSYPTPIDARTVLYVNRAEDGSGPWLWALDVEHGTTHQLNLGLDRYVSLSASADGRRLVATLVNWTSSLWIVPILDRVAEESDANAFPVSTVSAQTPRFGGATLFYVSSRGTGDTLWRFDEGQEPVEVWKGPEGALADPPAVSPDGRQAVVVVTTQGKRHLDLISIDAAQQQTLAEGIDVRGASSWSPDAKWIVTSGLDAQGPGLFKIPIDGGPPIRLVTGQAAAPIWAPDGSMIIYSRQWSGFDTQLLAVRPDGHAVQLSSAATAIGGTPIRFLPNGKGLVYMRGPEFWQLDLVTNETRQLARLTAPAVMQTFDITRDGKQIVFDRLRFQTDLVLIERPKS